ncbi:MAG: tRNA-dihydrouridine synthase [Candidatus Roizmanbacteria bacterium]
MNFFWQQLNKPIIGLAPMDGVTDPAFRYIVDKYGKPSILMTEFTNVEGINRGAHQLLRTFIHHETTTPTIAQVFGADPDSFYKVAFIVTEMGFDGIDINMGCPDKNITKHGGGAGLILQPKLAQAIVRSVKQGIKDWSEGRNIEEVGLPDIIVQWVKQYIINKKKEILRLDSRLHGKDENKKNNQRSLLPVSIKTRIGFENVITEEWMKHLLEVEPANISLHGRTFRQLYTGEANWDEIHKASKLIHSSGLGTTILGNGDVLSIEDAKIKSQTYGTDGVLIGRASFGNPWVFQGQTVDTVTRFKIAIEHCHVFEQLSPTLHFLSLRKHLGWYCKGFNDATTFRYDLMQVKNAKEAEEILSRFLG